MPISIATKKHTEFFLAIHPRDDKKIPEGLRILSNAMTLSPEIKCPAFWHENICAAMFSVSN